jgi:hypothetical protein
MRLAVEGAAAGRAAGGHANRDGAGRVRAPVERGRLIDDLIEADRGEVGELHLNDRTRTLDGGADGHADHGILADRGVKHAAGELFAEILGGLEGSAEGADVLPVKEDGGSFLSASY